MQLKNNLSDSHALYPAYAESSLRCSTCSGSCAPTTSFYESVKILTLWSFICDLAWQASLSSNDHNLGMHPRVLEKNPVLLSMKPPDMSLCIHVEQRPPGILQARHRATLVSTCSHEIHCSSSDTIIKSPVNPGFPQPSTFRPRTFSAPRRFTPLDNLPVLFHTGATPEVQRANIILNHCALTAGKPEKSTCYCGELSPQVNTIRAIMAGMISFSPQDKPKLHNM